MNEEHRIKGIPLVPGPSREKLNAKQLEDYRIHREQFIKWLLHLGKDPDRARGFSQGTCRRTAYRIDLFYRWVWEDEGYTVSVTPDHADEYIQEEAYTDKSVSHKSKTLSSLKRLFKWRHHEFGDDRWEPDITFTSSGGNSPRDFFTMEERKKLRQAALEYDSVPNYGDLAPEERGRWKAHIAQKLGKPKSEVTPDDWEEVNSWKITSMVCVSLDVGLRPKEVERATVSWVDLDNGLLRIPHEESTKNRDNWTPVLTDRTVRFLDQWLQERETRSKYDGRDALWLTREANPYQSQSLRYVLQKLCDMAGIETRNRQISWYTIRHSVGTGMAHERGLKAVKVSSVTTRLRPRRSTIRSRRTRSVVPSTTWADPLAPNHPTPFSRSCCRPVVGQFCRPI
jgi:site-specific recombinase XerD